MQVLRWGWTVAATVALCGSCSKNNDIKNTTNNNYTTINNISQVVGPQGAHIGTPDTAQIDIPAGALTQDVTIELGEVTEGGPSIPVGVTRLSGVWAITPHGQTFAQDVVVTLPHSAGNAQVGVMRAEVDGAFVSVPASDVTSGTVAAKTTSFSFFVAVHDADAGAGGSAGAGASGGVAGQGSGAFGGGGSGNAGGSGGCAQDPEPNDSEDTAAMLASIDDCDGSGSSILGSLPSGDSDWYSFPAIDAPVCTAGPTMTRTAGSAITMCAYVECMQGVANVTCGTAQASTSPLGRAGCCTTDAQLTTSFDCGGTGDDATVWMQVSSSVPDDCYSIDYHN